jgi:hypothetical protein
MQFKMGHCSSKVKLIRENALKMLTGEIPVQMEITNWPNPPKN